MRNRSLAQKVGLSSLIPAVVAIGLLAGSSASASDPVYHWKDASGQSHYSQSLPEKGIKYEVINASGTTVTTAAPPAGKSETPAASGTAPAANNAPTTADAQRQQRCDAAKKNVEVLESRPLVTMDIDNSGKPKTLTPQEQRDQLAHFKDLANTFCVK